MMLLIPSESERVRVYIQRRVIFGGGSLTKTKSTKHGLAVVPAECNIAEYGDR